MKFVEYLEKMRESHPEKTLGFIIRSAEMEGILKISGNKYKGIELYFEESSECTLIDAMYAADELISELGTSDISVVYVYGDKDGKIYNYVLKGDYGFERIRRITGYLVGTLDRFNDAKKSEESERVKHKI